MKNEIQLMLEKAEALDKELHLMRSRLGTYDGEQLNETSTERQLDRWTQERGMDEAINVAVTHMAKVLGELRWIYEGLEK